MQKLLLLFPFSLTLTILKAQKTVDGYYVRLKGDTVNTKIVIPVNWDGPDWEKLTTIASFYPEKENRVAYVKPEQIKAYGFIFKKKQYSLTSELADLFDYSFTGINRTQGRKFMLNVFLGSKINIFKLWHSKNRMTGGGGPSGTGMTMYSTTRSTYTISLDNKSFFLTDDSNKKNILEGIESIFSNYPYILSKVNVKSISLSNLEDKLIEIARLINNNP